jgi:hypothetical protein
MINQNPSLNSCYAVLEKTQNSNKFIESLKSLINGNEPQHSDSSDEDAKAERVKNVEQVKYLFKFHSCHHQETLHCYVKKRD